MTRNFSTVRLTVKCYGTNIETLYTKLIQSKYIVDKRGKKDEQYLIVEYPESEPTIVPPGTEKFIAMLSAEEQGGSGEAVIICGGGGKKLKPYFVNRKDQPNGRHAFFCVQHTIARIWVDDKSNASIVKYTVDELDGVFTITPEELWSGMAGEHGQKIPSRVEKFSGAILAGYKKANIYNCVEPYYAVV